MLKQFSVQYPQISSAIHTFIAVFIVTVAGAVSLIPTDQILSPATWGTAAIAGIITAGIRAAIKAVSPIA